METRKKILQQIGRRCALEQLAEELSEASQAALKLIRAEGLSENVTPVEAQAARAALVSELVDVMMCVQLVEPEHAQRLNGLALCSPKWQRWADRIEQGGR